MRKRIFGLFKKWFLTWGSMKSQDVERVTSPVSALKLYVEWMCRTDVHFSWKGVSELSSASQRDPYPHIIKGHYLKENTVFDWVR